MIQTETPVGRFFDLYARETANSDLPAIVSHFADPFLSGNPSGSQVVRVADFFAALPRRKAMFARLGSQPAELIALQETPLDSRFILARTTWRMSFVRENLPAHQLDAESTFLVDTGSPGSDPADFKILLYLSHQDPVQILRDRGILEEQPQSAG